MIVILERVGVEDSNVSFGSVLMVKTTSDSLLEFVHLAKRNCRIIDKSNTDIGFCSEVVDFMYPMR